MNLTAEPPERASYLSAPSRTGHFCEASEPAILFHMTEATKPRDILRRVVEGVMVSVMSLGAVATAGFAGLCFFVKTLRSLVPSLARFGSYKVVGVSIPALRAWLAPCLSGVSPATVGAGVSLVHRYSLPHKCFGGEGDD